MKPIFVKSNITGGHYALKTAKSSKPFTNRMGECKSIELFNSDIVADIGAYVGEYSMYASRQGVKKVLSYEPTPQTFQILKMNAKANMHLYNMAVTGTKEKYVNLFISKGIGVTNSIAKIKESSMQVKAIQYQEALQDATVVKIDVEGAEYGYNIIQPNLRAIILEFHPLVAKPWQQMAKEIMNNLEDNGFKAIKRPRFRNGWDLTGAWQK